MHVKDQHSCLLKKKFWNIFGDLKTFFLFILKRALRRNSRWKTSVGPLSYWNLLISFCESLCARGRRGVFSIILLKSLLISPYRLYNSNHAIEKHRITFSAINVEDTLLCNLITSVYIQNNTLMFILMFSPKVPPDMISHDIDRPWKIEHSRL